MITMSRLRTDCGSPGMMSIGDAAAIAVGSLLNGRQAVGVVPDSTPATK